MPDLTIPPHRPPPRPLLKVRIDGKDPVVDVHLVGEMDLSTYGELGRAWALAAAPGPDVRLELARLRFCDVSGLGDLVVLRARLLEQHRNLVVLNPRPQVRRLLTLAGLGSMIAAAA